jgi:hypothetical protein
VTLDGPGAFGDFCNVHGVETDNTVDYSNVSAGRKQIKTFFGGDVVVDAKIQISRDVQKRKQLFYTLTVAAEQHIGSICEGGT